MKKTIGEVIKAQRKRRGWTQGQLGLYAKLSKAHISMIELGKRANPSIETIAKIAEALDVSLDYLVEESGLKPPSDDSQLAPEVDHLNKIIQAYPPGPLREQAEEIIIQIALALSHTLPEGKLDEIMAVKQENEDKST